jgi:hypothetical protein
MKHALLLIFLAVSTYTLWQVSDRTERNKALKQITKHGLFIGAIVTLILVVLDLAVYFPSTSLI